MRYELTDYEWAAVRPFLPNKPRGVPRVNDRRVLNGIFWVCEANFRLYSMSLQVMPSRGDVCSLGCLHSAVLRSQISMAGRAILTNSAPMVRGTPCNGL